MIDKFLGDAYLFELEINPHGRKFDFHLFAIDRRTLHYSNINDLTTILSWLGIEDGDSLVDDKCWTISKGKMTKFSKVIREALTNGNSIRYLEDQIDEDRRYGEWANQLQNSERD